MLRRWKQTTMKGSNVTQPNNEPIAPAEFAANVRTLLDEDVRRYRNFGVYWFFVKAVLKRFYDRHQMPILGDYEDKTVNERIPEELRTSLGNLLEAAAEEYQQNASFNLGRNELTDPNGEFFTLLDPDVEG